MLLRSMDAYSIYLLFSLYRGLKRIAIDLRTIDLDREKPEELAELMDMVQKLHAHANKIRIGVQTATETSGRVIRKIRKKLLDQIEADLDSIGDVVESYHLSSNEDFRAILDNAVTELKNTGKIPPGSASDSLAKVQD